MAASGFAIEPVFGFQFPVKIKKSPISSNN
jgi:hypothetical protein